VIGSRTDDLIGVTKIAYKAAPSTTPNLETVQFLVRLFQIVKEHAMENDCDLCKSILLEASRDNQK
jgi:hypothetical protein